MTFERIRRIADAVLLEGYVLYPYRASAPKNRFRWAFGVIAPRGWEGERSFAEVSFLVAGEAPRISGRLRFLHLQRRTVEAARGNAYVPVPSLEAGDRLLLPWDEGELRELDLGEGGLSIDIPSSLTYEAAAGGRVIREAAALRGVVTVATERLDAERALRRFRVRVENHTPCDPAASRDEMVRAAFLSAHLAFTVEGGAFVSLLDPPAWAKEAAAGCSSAGLYPVLAGAPGSEDLLLASPIILYDHPQIAPESTGDFFDAAEIDELLALRTRTLTDEEKRVARATDARAAAIVDRAEAMEPEALAKLHGALRDLRGAEMVPIWKAGDRVRLRPGARRTDAQDLLYAGRTAVVEKVEQDLDGRDVLALTIEDDPAAELHRWYGRFHYYYLDEVEKLP